MPTEELSKRRREMVSRAFDALNRRDRAEITELIPDDAEFVSAVGAIEGSGVYRGPQQFLELYETLLGTWDDLTWHLDSVEEAGDRSAVVYRITGVAKGSGVPLEQPLSQVWTWREGEVAPSRVEIYTDSREAPRRVGVD